MFSENWLYVYTLLTCNLNLCHVDVVDLRSSIGHNWKAVLGSAVTIEFTEENFDILTFEDLAKIGSEV